jgi:hypothetical protein
MSPETIHHLWIEHFIPTFPIGLYTSNTSSRMKLGSQKGQGNAPEACWTSAHAVGVMGREYLEYQVSVFFPVPRLIFSPPEESLFTLEHLWMFNRSTVGGWDVLDETGQVMFTLPPVLHF